MTVAETASFLNTSQSWVRRHLAELPQISLGRLIRIDGVQLRSTIEARKSLRPEGACMRRRYQRGSVKYDKGLNVWIGRFRVDMPDGNRPQKKVRIGTKQQYPNATEARDRLDDIRRELSGRAESQPTAIPADFAALVQRWKASEGPTLGDTTLKHYVNALNAYVLPTFRERPIHKINHEELQIFLNEKASKYSKSALRSMRVTLRITMAWAIRNRWIDHNPAEKLRLPKRTAGRKLIRVILLWSQIVALMEQMQEPYRTLVLFLALVPKRIEEAIALKPGDLDSSNVLHVHRAMYEGKLVEFAEHEYERIPLDAPVHAALVRRLRALGEGHEWTFHSKRGTPLNPGNGLRRKLHPAAKTIGLRLGGWHDFRHSFATAMSRAGVRLKVRTAALGQRQGTGVLAHDVYDHASDVEIRQALVVGANWLMQEEAIQQQLLGSQLCPQMCPDTVLQPGQSVNA